MSYRPTLCLYLAASCFVAVLAACHDDDEPKTSDGQYPFVKVTWTNCPLNDDEPEGRIAECASIPVPLDWDAPSHTLELFVRRLRGAESQGEKQIWILHGGPDSSAAFGPMLGLLADEISEADVYTLDHRGTGRSTRLECDADLDNFLVSDADIEQCTAQLEQEWGDGLQDFTTTAAARDVGYLMDLMDQQQRAERFLYGGSYGTLWAQRFLQIYPDALSGVIIEGIASPTYGFETTNSLGQTPFNDLLENCGEDPFCSEKLGSNPGDTLDQLLERLGDEAHCDALFQALRDDPDLPTLVQRSPATVAKVLLWALMEQGWDGRLMVPAVIHRLERCSPADVEALYYLIQVLAAVEGEDSRYASPALSYHIHLTTYWNMDVTECTTLPDGEYDDYRIYNDAPHQLCRLLGAGWPTAQRDEYQGGFARTATPMLMLNGAEDVQTPTAGGADVASHFQGEYQHFFEFPRTGHSPLFDSFVTTPDGATCGIRMALGFLRDPKGVVDASCMDAIREFDFSGHTSMTVDHLAETLFNSSDLFD